MFKAVSSYDLKFFSLCVVWFGLVIWYCWLGDKKGIWPAKNIAQASHKGSSGGLQRTW